MGGQEAFAYLSRLEQNWDSYGSQPIANSAIREAESLANLGTAEGLGLPHVSPVSGGGVQLEWHGAGHSLEFVVWPDGSFEYVQSEDPWFLVAEGELPGIDREAAITGMRWYRDHS